MGVIDPQPLITALAAIGISVQPGENGETQPKNSLRVVLTDDYLQPELEQINQKALQTQQPWLLVKPISAVLWLGPIFHPSETGCWQCLAQRLHGNREVEASVLRQKGETGCLPLAFAGLPSTVQTAISLTTTEIAKWLVKQAIPASTSPLPSPAARSCSCKTADTAPSPPTRFCSAMSI
jgi:ribosomal protein S12 methylthiotransferase accessory factor